MLSDSSLPESSDSDSESEFDSNSPAYNRKSKDVKILTQKELEQDFSISSTRWIVLETPVPEEQVVACARLKLNKDVNNCAYFRFLATINRPEVSLSIL